MSRRTNAASGKPSRAPLVELMLTDASGVTKVLTDKHAMEQAAIHELSHRPQQSIGTDLMQPAMIQDLSYLGTGQGARDILDGIYVPPSGASQWVREWATQNRAVHNTAPTAPWISSADHIAGWKWTKERTAS